jgi:hypothetical protein
LFNKLDAFYILVINSVFVVINKNYIVRLANVLLLRFFGSVREIDLVWKSRSFVKIHVIINTKWSATYRELLRKVHATCVVFENYKFQLKKSH